MTPSSSPYDGAAPDGIEPFRGYRIWRVAFHGHAPRLSSVYRPVVWPTAGALTAECLSSLGNAESGPAPAPHRVPSASCRCGIYARPVEGPEGWDGAMDALEDVARGGWRSGPIYGVVGVVSGWGRVVVAERGWRAEYGRPSALLGATPAKDNPAYSGSLLAELATTYKIPWVGS